MKTKTCLVCGKEFKPSSGSQKYCFGVCRETIDRERHRKWKRKWLQDPNNRDRERERDRERHREWLQDPNNRERKRKWQRKWRRRWLQDPNNRERKRKWNRVSYKKHSKPNSATKAFFQTLLLTQKMKGKN